MVGSEFPSCLTAAALVHLPAKTTGHTARALQLNATALAATCPENVGETSAQDFVRHERVWLTEFPVSAKKAHHAP
jgi:hypothetical protein